MSENKRLIMVFVAIVVVIGVILLISFWPEPDKTFSCGVKADGDYAKLGNVDYKQYQCLYKSDSKNAIVVADKLSKAKKNALNKTAKKLGHAIYYIDTDKVSTKQLNTIKKQLKYKDNDNFKTDALVVVQNKKVTTYTEAKLTDTTELNKFLKTSGIAKFACNVTAQEDYENIGDVTYEQFECLYESDEPFVLVIEQTTCGYCHKFNPVINTYAGDNNLPIYAIQMDKLDSDQKTALQDSFKSYFETNTSWGTPLSLAVKNKEVVTDLSGYTDDESEIDNLYEELGLK